MFREYANDIPACMHLEYQAWERGEIEDNIERRAELAIEWNEDNISPITRYLKTKKDVGMTVDEEWDFKLSREVNKVEN